MSYDEHRSPLLSKLAKYRVTPEVSSAEIYHFFSSLDCPRSLTAWLLYESGEHEQLANLEIDPLWFDTPHRFRDAYQATKFLSKFKSLSLNYDLDEVAKLKFKKFENQCKQTNVNFKSKSWYNELNRGTSGWLHNAIIRKISSVLGDFDVEEMFSLANWGPGATTLIKSANASPTNKFQCETGITRDLYALLPIDAMRANYPLWASHLTEIGFPQFQTGNKVVTVPKDATQNRVIAIEPGINLWFQKAIGQMIRKRLRRHGIDLRYQSRNQYLAYIGSLRADCATVDFSSASDSIAFELVQELIPPDWFEVMNSCRSHFGKLGEDQFMWSKFSSMGNAFTFELETLIFWATAFCCCQYRQVNDSNLSVYGDDVVIPIGVLDLFSEMSKLYGFTINEKKTHFSSPFRESCGSHFFSGVDVKPIYLKDRLSSALTVYRLANNVRRLAHRNNANYGCDARFRTMSQSLISRVPKSLRLMIPENLGDGGFISNQDEAVPVRAKRGFEGFLVRHVSEVARSYQTDVYGLLLARIWDPSTQEERTTVPLRGQTIFLVRHLNLLAELERGSDQKQHGNAVYIRGRTKVRISRSIVAQWYDLGPWL